MNLTIGVLHGHDLLVIVKIVEQRSEDPPAGIQFVVSNKVRVVALERVKDERLVGLGDLEVGEATAVRQVELCDDGLHAEAGQLRVHLDIHALVGLHADNQLITWDILKNARRDILELDADFGLLLVEGLAGLQDEGHAVPALVLDVCDHGGEGRAAGVAGNRLILLVARLRAVQRLSVLTNDDIARLDGGHGTKNADLLVANVLGGEGDGTLHGEQS